MKKHLMHVATFLVLLAPMALAAQTVVPSGTQSKPAPSAQAAPSQPPAPSEQPAAGSSAKPSVEIHINDKEMEERLNRAFNDPELERRIERQIERIGDRFEPHEWRGPAALAMMIPLSGIAFGALTVWLIYRRNRERMQARMDMHTALLAKFNSGAEFTEFISSPGGRAYMEQITTPHHSGGNLYRSTWIGYLFTLMGAGLLIGRIIEGRSLTGGLVLLAIGIAYLLSARSAREATEKLRTSNGMNGGSGAATLPPPAGSSSNYPNQ